MERVELHLLVDVLIVELRWVESRRKRYGTGFRPMPGKVQKQLGKGHAERGRVADFKARAGEWPSLGLEFIEIENQCVCTQTGNVSRCVKSIQRIVEFIGQEDFLQLRFGDDLLLPVG